MSHKTQFKLHEPTENELLLARRMARAGASIEEVHAALKWECTPATTYERLKRMGIRVRHPKTKRAHLGDETSLGR